MRAQTAQKRKDELVAALQVVRSQLLAVACAIPPDKQNIPFLGTWSVNDLVAHFAGWDAANLAAIHAVRAGRLPDFYDHYDAGWKTFNAQLVAEHKRESLVQTMAGAEASHEALLAELASTPAQDVVRDFGARSPRGRRVTIVMLLGAEARDEQVHLAQLREFADQLLGEQ